MIAQEPKAQRDARHFVVNPDGTAMRCNICEWVFEYYAGLEEEWNYCPHCGMRAEEFISMADYINKVDLLLTIAELPNNASKKDILRVVYDAEVLQISLSATGEISLRAIV